MEPRSQAERGHCGLRLSPRLTLLLWAAPQVKPVAAASLLHLHSPGLEGQELQTGCVSLELYVLRRVVLVGLLVHQQEHDTASRLPHLHAHTQARAGVGPRAPRRESGPSWTEGPRGRVQQNTRAGEPGSLPWRSLLCPSASPAAVFPCVKCDLAHPDATWTHA